MPIIREKPKSVRAAEVVKNGRGRRAVIAARGAMVLRGAAMIGAVHAARDRREESATNGAASDAASDGSISGTAVDTNVSQGRLWCRAQR